MKDLTIQQMTADLSEAQATSWLDIKREILKLIEIPADLEPVVESSFKSGWATGSAWMAKWIESQI